MKRLVLILMVLTVTLALAISAAAAVKKAKGGIVLSDPAGDAKKNGFDVVELAIASDGKQIKFNVTLKEPPGDYADSVIEVFFDTDNNPQSGAKLFFADDKMGVGYNYTSKLKACIKYDNGITACSGGSKAKVLDRFGAMDLQRYKGKSESGKEEIVARMGGMDKKKAKRIPIKGKVVQGVLDYADLKVKPGQTIRIMVWESGVQTKKSALFPEVLLTLK